MIYRPEDSSIAPIERHFDIANRTLCHAILWIIASSGKGIKLSQIEAGELVVILEDPSVDAIAILNKKRIELLEGCKELSICK